MTTRKTNENRVTLQRDPIPTNPNSLSPGFFYKLSSLALATLLISTPIMAADLTPDEGLKRLSQNIETSTNNRNEYNKAIEQVSHNITTLDSAAGDLQVQKKKIQGQINENKTTLALHNKKLQELDRSRQEEERKKLADQNKIAQLEKTLAQLKELQIARQDRIEKLTQDRTALVNSQKEGEALQLTLNQETKTLDQRIEALKKEVNPWKTKKKSYEKEAARWNTELDRHQKMETEVKLLMDETT